RSKENPMSFPTIPLAPVREPKQPSFDEFIFDPQVFAGPIGDPVGNEATIGDAPKSTEEMAMIPFWRRRNQDGTLSGPGKIEVEEVQSQAELQEKVVQALREAESLEKGNALWSQKAKPVLESPKIEELYQRIVDGDAEAFDQLVEV